MCHSSCLDFGRQNILYSDVHGKFVLEVGSMDVNGSLRPIVMQLNPAKYVGVDLDLGPGVDEICASENLIERFGRNSVDLLITTEMLEHVRDWRSVVHNLKHVVKPGGVLLVTTRSRGYPLHGYPSDYWRFEI
jgi:SAM-dependent methyltransferase